MMITSSEYKTPNEKLYQNIQKFYDEYFKPETPYTHGKFHYDNATSYGYTNFERRDFYGQRQMTADEYVAFSGTHCDHMVIPEPYKTKFFQGLHDAVMNAGNKIVFNDTYILYLARKLPMVK